MSNTIDHATQSAHETGSQAVDGASKVARTAASETKDVAAQAVGSARDLLHQVRGEVGDQAGTQQKRVATGLSGFADQLDDMGRDQQSGLASSLVSQLADRARTTGDWLSSREPDDLVQEARQFAARRPGAFLAAAAAVGFLGARLTRGLGAAASAAHADEQPDHLPERSFPPAPSYPEDLTPGSYSPLEGAAPGGLADTAPTPRVGGGERL